MTLPELIKILLNTAISFAAIVAAGALIFNGFKYMSSSGDTSKAEEAQKGIASALIGLVVVISAAVIVNFVLNTLGMEPVGLEGPQIPATTNGTNQY